MNSKRKLTYGIVGGSLVLLLIGTSVYNIFTGTHQAQQAEQMAMQEGNMGYSLYTVLPQDPISLSGRSELQTDTSYFYNPELGEVETLAVADGQTIKKGDLLFSYFQDKNKHDLEDAQREQTRLYNQREELIAQLGKITEALYNYQGDQIATYWGEGGKQHYYVVEEIGVAASQSGESTAEDEQDAGAEGIKQQIRQLNQQIEDVEIKLVRAKEAQHNTVKAQFNGRVMVDERGLTNSQIPLVRIISDDVAIVGSVNEYEFFVLGKERQAVIFVNAEEREVTGKMVDYSTVPTAQAAPSGDNVTAPSSGGSAANYSYMIAPDEYVQPGFSVKVRITMPGYQIPQDVIVEEQGRQFVYVYRDGIVKKVPIELTRQGTTQVVMQGVSEGDQLVLFPYDLRDGQTIEVAVMEELKPFADMEAEK